MKRRDFVKYAGGGIATLFVGSMMPSWISGNKLFATEQVQELNFTISDGIKNMATHNAINKAQCYFWFYKEKNFPAEVPGPHIFTTAGNIVKVTVTNGLDEPHAFYIPGLVDTGPIRPGETKTVQFVPDQAGTLLHRERKSLSMLVARKMQLNINGL